MMFTNNHIKKLLVIAVLLLNSCGPASINEGCVGDTYENTYLLNDCPTFQECLEGMGFDTATDDYAAKRTKILSAMSELFWRNIYVKDEIGPKNPGVVGVAYEKMYGGFELYCIYQLEAWGANHNERITSIEQNHGYYIAYSMDGEPILPISERLDTNYSSEVMILNEIAYYLAIRDNPFQYYAIANVFESDRQVIDIIDNMEGQREQVPCPHDVFTFLWGHTHIPSDLCWQPNP